MNRRQLLRTAGAGAIATVAAPVLALVPPPGPGLGLRAGDCLHLFGFSTRLEAGVPIIRLSFRVNDRPHRVEDLPIPPDGFVTLGQGVWLQIHPTSLANILRGGPFVGFVCGEFCNHFTNHATH